MLERNAVRLVQTAIDTSLGWGESQVALCEPPTDQLREMCRWKGSGGRLLRVRREAFGFGFQRIRAQSHVVIDLNDTPDDLVQSAIEQCRPTIRAQSELKARAACAGFQSPLDREQFASPERLSLDAAAAQALRHELGSDAAVLTWLRARLGHLFDRGPVSRFFVFGFTIFVPFRLGPLRLSPDGDIASHEDHWCGRDVHLKFPSSIPEADVPALFEDVLSRTPIAQRPVVSLSPWPTAEMVAAVRRCLPPMHQGRFLPADGTVTWRAVLEERLVRIDEAFG